jgi:hypothetical protein
MAMFYLAILNFPAVNLLLAVHCCIGSFLAKLCPGNVLLIF